VCKVLYILENGEGGEGRSDVVCQRKLKKTSRKINKNKNK
jgi:hypothetical protein